MICSYFLHTVKIVDLILMTFRDLDLAFCDMFFDRICFVDGDANLSGPAFAFEGQSARSYLRWTLSRNSNYRLNSRNFSLHSCFTPSQILWTEINYKFWKFYKQPLFLLKQWKLDEAQNEAINHCPIWHITHHGSISVHCIAGTVTELERSSNCKLSRVAGLVILQVTEAMATCMHNRVITCIFSDMDECTTNTHACVKGESDCINTHGTYICKCRTGYIQTAGDNRKCEGELRTFSSAILGMHLI